MCAAVYIILATGMFFFQDTYFSIGGMELSLKNPCAVAILFLALLNFIATVRLDRLLLLTRHTLVQMFPCLVPLVFSAVIWVGGQAESATVWNGITMVIPQLLSVLVAAATLYLFGEKGIWYCLRYYYVQQVNRREWLCLLRLLANALLSLGIYIRERPDAVVCTGVLAMVPLCLLCKLFGKKLVFIESYAKVKTPTLTGKLLYPFADRFYVQWPELLEVYPRAVCLGGIF